MSRLPFDLPPLTPGYLSTDPADELSADQRRTLRNQAELDAGRHPATGAPLLHPDWEFQCRDCIHAHRVEGGARRFWKCDLHRLGMSRSAASDIRIGWPACTRLTIEARRKVDTR
jgi:hypothetical protein